MSSFNPSVSSRERNPLNLLRKVNGHPAVGVEAAAGAEAYRVLTAEPYFLQAVGLERKRAERSGKHLLLMLLGGEKVFNAGEKAIYQVRAALAASIRETDLSGWYRQGETVRSDLHGSECGERGCDHQGARRQGERGPAKQAELRTPAENSPVLSPLPGNHER